MVIRYSEDLGDDAGADGLAAFADGEAQLLFERDRGDELDRPSVMLSPGITIFDALGQLDGAGHVGRAEVELRAVVGEERRVTAALFLLQDVDLALNFLCGVIDARLGQHLAALDVAPSRCRGAGSRRCRPPGPGRAACGTSRRP